MTSTPSDRPPAGEDVERFGHQQELRRSSGVTDLLVHGLVVTVPC